MDGIIKEFSDAIENTKEILMKGVASNIQNMSEEEFNMLKEVLKLIDVSTRFITIQAEKIDDINNKLDALIEK